MIGNTNHNLRLLPCPQVYLTRLAAHPVLRYSRQLQTFLEAGEEEWALEQAKVQVS